MPSWRRRLLQVLPRLGVDVRESPSGVLASRGAGPRVHALSDDLAVVSRRRLERFEREKQLVRFLVHQHVVTILRLTGSTA